MSKEPPARYPNFVVNKHTFTMNTLLWILQGFLALTFAYSGFMKSSQEREKLVSAGQTGVANLSYPIIRFIGISELLGAVGITVPWLTGILHILTPVSAVCFAAIMVMAMRIHYRRGEYRSVTLNVLLFAASVFVAYARFREI